MLVGSLHFVTSTARYRAVSESTADAATDEEDRDCDDDARGGGAASSAYESFSTCDSMLTNADDTTAKRSHPRTGIADVFVVFSID